MSCYLSEIHCMVDNKNILLLSGDTPNYRCAIPDGSNINESIPQICDADGKCEYDQCHMYRYGSN